MKTRRKRTIHVIIATTILFAPASALALTGVTTAAGQTVPKPLDLNVTPRQVKFGHAVTVTGAAPRSDAGKRVLLQRETQSGAAWRSIASTRVGHHGRFHFRVAPRASGMLRAVEVSTGPTALISRVGTPTSSQTSSASAPHPVTVKARFAAVREQFAGIGSGGLRVAGALLPASSGRAVQLQDHTPRGWHTLTTGRTGGRGGFTLRSALHGAHGQRLRVLFGGDDVNGAATVPAGTAASFSTAEVSWYNDAGNTACGYHAGLGVANKTLPCGTKVALRYGGRTVTATVDDRGPYVGGRLFDLNQNTAAALGFAGVGEMQYSIQ